MSRRMRRPVALLAAAVLAAGAATASAPDASADTPATVYVNPAEGGTDHTDCGQSANACGTIQYALDAVASGGTVIVEPGTYNETPQITHAVTLVGHQATIGGLAVGDAAGAVDVSGFTITSATPSSLVSVTDSVSGAAVSLHDNTLTGAADPQTAVAVSGNAADVSISANTVSATTTGIDLTGNMQQAAYTITDNSFAITQGTGAAIALDAPGDADVVNATVAGNSGTVSPDGRTITRSGTGTISVPVASPPNRLSAAGTSIAVPDAPTTLTTLEDPTSFTATVSSGSTLPSAVLDVTVAAPAGTTADELVLSYNLDGASTYTDVPLHGSGPYQATITDLSGLDAADPVVVHLRLAALDGTTAGALPVTLGLDETAPDRSVVNTAASTTLPMSAVVNTVPTATPQPSVGVARNGSTDITLAATDADGDPIIGWAHSSAAHGTLTTLVDDRHLRYTRAAGYSGTDSFTFTATDKAGTSTPATVSISVSADTRPQANDLTVADRIPHGASNVPIDLSGLVSDADGDPLTFSIVTAPAHGSVTVDPSSGAASYTAAADFGGTDSFTYQVNDGALDSSPATVTLVVDSPPVVAAPNPSPSVPHNHTVQVTLSANDPEGDALTWSAGPNPSHGTVAQAGTSSTFAFTPTTDYVGAGSFTVSVSDPYAGVTTVTVPVDITDQAPTITGPAEPVRVDYNATAPKAIPLTCSDGDPGDVARIATPVSQPADGAVTATDCTVSYRPTAGATGADSFTVQASDGHLTSTAFTVQIVIDTPPTAVIPPTEHVGLGKPVTLQLAATDPDQDTIAYAVGTPDHGAVTRSGSLVTYVAPTNWAGQASFPFTANDGHGGVSTGTVHVIVDEAPSTITTSLSPARPTSAQHPTLTVHVSTAGRATNGVVAVATGSGTRTARVARNGTAALSLPSYPGGTQKISVTFRGTSTAAPSRPRTVPFTVTKVASSLTVTTNPLQLTTKTTNATATIRVGAGPLSADSGTATIDENGRRLAIGTVRRGLVTLRLPRFTLGQHNLTITYTGTSAIAAASVVQVERVSLGP